VNLVAKLLDVAPQGKSYLVSHENMGGRRASAVGQYNGLTVYSVTIPMRPTSYQFAKGHRLRMSVSGSDFPFIWPTPRRYALQLLRGQPYGTELVLPIVPEQKPPLAPPTLRPLPLPARIKDATRDRGATYSVTRYLTSQVAAFSGRRWAKVEVEPNTTYSSDVEFGLSVDAEHPERANTWETAVVKLERPTASVEVKVDAIVTLRAISMQARVRLDGRPFWERSWEKRW